ncbi:MAG: hypothetical protein ACPG7F_01725 [Aggregatilineales bacterium]
METTELIPTIASLVLIVVVSATTGGGIAAIGILAFLNRLKDDPAFMKSVEQLGSSVPQEHADKLIELSKIIRISTEVVEEALDGIPASEKSIVSDGTLEQTPSTAAILTTDHVANVTG